MSNGEETEDKLKMRDSLQNNRLEHFKIFKVIKIKEKKNCSRLKEPKGHDNIALYVIRDWVWYLNGCYWDIGKT